MGADKLAYCGMDDAGEMSAWYIFNAIGLYTYSPADPEYLLSVPLFDQVTFALDNNVRFTITKQKEGSGSGQKITGVTYGGKKVKGWFISHDQLKQGKELIINTK